MADLCCQYTFGSVIINNSSTTTNSLITDFDEGSITGLDGAPVRRQIDNKGQTSGGIAFGRGLFGPRIVTFTGKLAIVTVDGVDPLSLWAAINTLEAATVSALESVINSTTNLSWTPTGGAARSLPCQYGTQGGEIQFSGNMADRRFTFTLVSESSTIS